MDPMLAAQTVVAFKETMNGVRNLMENVEDMKNIHLTNYIKRSMVSSRVFIQKACTEEPILNDLLGSIQQLYLSWIMTAINMNQYVDNMRTVRNLMDVVSTEGFLDANNFMRDDETLIKGLSSFNGMTYKSQPQLIGAADTIKTIKTVTDTIGKTRNVTEAVKSGNKTKEVGSTSIKDITPVDINISYGRIVEISFVGQNGAKLSINMFVQLLPTIMPDIVMEQFFKLNYKPDLKQRWFQFTAGEISFWKDFIFELDQVEKKNKAIKEDKTGMLKEMYNELFKNTKNKMKKHGQYSPSKQNIASTIHIYDKSSFHKWCGDNRVDFRNFAHRERYFSDTLSMIVATIDPAYEKIDMYFAGISGRAEYNFNQIKVQSKNNNYDLTSVMKAFSSANAPRF